jgi:hypothetical protein
MSEPTVEERLRQVEQRLERVRQACRQCLAATAMSTDVPALLTPILRALVDEPDDNDDGPQSMRDGS